MIKLFLGNQSIDLNMTCSLNLVSQLQRKGSYLIGIVFGKVGLKKEHFQNQKCAVLDLRTLDIHSEIELFQNVIARSED